jgi:hypothetical protein
MPPGWEGEHVPTASSQEVVHMSKQDEPSKGPSEEMKAKFRAALDKKHAHGGKDVSDDHDRSKVHGAHGPAKAQQMFRRKAGG